MQRVNEWIAPRRHALTLVLLTALGGALHAQEASTVGRPAVTETVAAVDQRMSRSYPAIVYPSREAQVSFRVGGQVIELPALAATFVEEGTVIARLDPSDFEAQIVLLESQKDQAEAELSALQAGARTEEVNALEAAVASAQAQVDQARDAAERTRELAERGVVSEVQVEQDEATLRVAEATLAAQEENLAIGLAGGREEEIAAAEAVIRGLDSQIGTAQLNLDHATLRAPFAGVIANRYIDNFALVQPGEPIVLLQSLDPLHLVFDIPGPDVTVLTTVGGIETSAGFDAVPDARFDAELVEFSTQADTATLTYRGRVAVPAPTDVRVLPGMVGEVTASTPAGELDDVMVPLSAIGTEPDGAPFLWIVSADDRVSKRSVVLGDPVGDRVLVVEGLAPGEVVVTAGVSQLQDGLSVRPVTEIGG